MHARIWNRKNSRNEKPCIDGAREGWYTDRQRLPHTIHTYTANYMDKFGMGKTYGKKNPA